MNKKIIFAVISGLLIVAVGAVSLISASNASAASNSVRCAATTLDNPPARGGRPGKGGDDGATLAQVLGITLEELQAAQQAAWQKAIDLALEQGLITQAQAELLKERQAGGFDRHGGMGLMFIDKDAIDMEALLAEQLGISLDELQAARQEAAQLALQARIESGELSEEQAELMSIRQAVKDYIDRQALTASALGMTVEDLESARQDGKSTADLIEEKGLTQEEFQAALQSAYAAAIQQAVADGVITQAQADLLLENMDAFGRGGMPGRAGGHPRGDRPAPENCTPAESQSAG